MHISITIPVGEVLVELAQSLGDEQVRVSVLAAEEAGEHVTVSLSTVLNLGTAVLRLLVPATAPLLTAGQRWRTERRSI